MKLYTVSFKTIVLAEDKGQAIEKVKKFIQEKNPEPFYVTEEDVAE